MRQRGLVAQQPLFADACRRTHDVRDPRMPEREQVLGRKPCAHAVVDLHERYGARVHVTIEADDRKAVLDEARDPLGR